MEAVVGTFFSSQDLRVNSRVKFGSQYNIWAANPSTTAFPTVSGHSWASGYYANALTGAGFRSHADFQTTTEAISATPPGIPTPPEVVARRGPAGTWEYKRMSYNGWGESNPGGLSRPSSTSCPAAGANAQLGQAKDSVTDISLSGQAGLSYRFTPDLMAYVQVSRGHKSKGFNLLAENSTNPTPASPRPSPTAPPRTSRANRPTTSNSASRASGSSTGCWSTPPCSTPW